MLNLNLTKQPKSMPGGKEQREHTIFELFCDDCPSGVRDVVGGVLLRVGWGDDGH